MENPLVLGVDIGGSHITAGLIDLEKRKLISTSLKHKEIDPHGEAEVILNCWCQVIEDAYAGRDIPRKIIGLAMPGPFDYETGVCLIKEQDKFKSLYRMNIRNELQSRLHTDPCDIKFVNDAEAFLKGEIFSTPVGDNSVLGITIGTGLGSALCVKGEVTDADLWNTPFHDGTAEQYLGGGWLINRYQQLTGLRMSGVKDISLKVKNDHNAKQVFAEFGRNLGKFFNSQIVRHNLTKIVIGGNVSYAFDHFSSELYDQLSNIKTPPEIRVSELKENAALLGAAAEVYDTILNGHKL